MKFQIVTVGMVPFSKEHIDYLSTNIGKSQQEIIEWDAQKRLRIRGKDEESKIADRAQKSFEEFNGALQAEYIIVNPYGEDNSQAWEKRIWGVELVIAQMPSIIKKYEGQKILLVLCGPSCVGKGPLVDALTKEQLNIGKATIYVDVEKRPPRDGESEGNPYYFRSLDEINKMIDQNPRQYIRFDVRGVTQALDLNDVSQLLNNNDIAFIEIFYTAIPSLRMWAKE